jgi:hypothetical protein
MFTKFENIFYIGRKKTPIAVKKREDDYLVKLGSGFASYTLETNKAELQALSNFIQNCLKD